MQKYIAMLLIYKAEHLRSLNTKRRTERGQKRAVEREKNACKTKLLQKEQLDEAKAK